MIPNIKTYFDKKVTILALMPMLQWSNHPHFLIYVHSKWKVTFLILKNGTTTHAIVNLYSSKYQGGKKIKTCQEQSHLVKGCFIKVFCKTIPVQNDHFWVVPRVIVLCRFDCTAWICWIKYISAMLGLQLLLSLDPWLTVKYNQSCLSFSYNYDWCSSKLAELVLSTTPYFRPWNNHWLLDIDRR